MKIHIKVFIILIISMSVYIAGGGALAAESHHIQKSQEDINTSQGYDIYANISSDNVATVEYEKNGRTIARPLATFTVDGYPEQFEGPSLDKGENWSVSVDLNNRFNVSKSSHQVEVVTLDNSYDRTIEKEYDLEDPDIPATRIQDVEVIETTYDGEPTAAVDVVFENPSPRGYSGNVYAHTLQTISARSVAIVPVNQNTTVSRIHLREGPDEEVEGELRMTTARLDEDKGLRDQVWFRGTADGETEWQREPYEPVGYRNTEDSYRYDTDEGFLESKGISPKQAAAGAALGIGFLIFLFRGRSKW
ncbi:hypothetical protein ACFQDG_02820 [Natronoarchaeum mannanilyticum]|uniref:Uncharacterized protein n=1 Tax=Natronoarchaeum mannanilyticum TaxID=926360 RepID=A0AAV3TD72_9EURY